MKTMVSEDRARLALLKKYGYDVPRARAFILQKAKLRPGKILEIGTGRGHLTTVLAKKGFDVVSVDIDTKAQATALAYLKEDKVEARVRLRKMNAEALRYADRAFPSVISVNFLHHAQNPETCLAEMDRVAGGTLILADINKKGAAILEKIHRQQGHSHPRSKLDLRAVRCLLEQRGWVVKTYYGYCQTVLVAERSCS